MTIKHFMSASLCVLAINQWETGVLLGHFSGNHAWRHYIIARAHVGNPVRSRVWHENASRLCRSAHVTVGGTRRHEAGKDGRSIVEMTVSTDKALFSIPRRLGGTGVVGVAE